MNTGVFRHHQQRQLTWTSINDQDYYDKYQPRTRSLDLPQARCVKHQPSRSDSNLRLCPETIECPASPSPICSPSYDTASSHASSPDNNPVFHEEVRESTITTERSSLLRNSEGHSRNSSFSAWSANALFDLGQRKPARALFEDKAEEEERPKRRIRQGFSVRRANLPRILAPEDSDHQITVESRKEDSELLQTSVQSCLETSPESSDRRNKTSTEPNDSSEGFDPTTPGKDFCLPSIDEEENLNNNARALESSGRQSDTGMDGEQHCTESQAKVKKKVDFTTYFPVRSSSVTSYAEDSLQLIRAEKDKEHKRNRLEAKTLAWKEAMTARVLTRLKREEDNIDAWENKQKDKANKCLEKAERKLEEIRTKTPKKIMRIHEMVERKKIAEKSKAEAETARVTALVERIRLTGNLPWKSLFLSGS